MKFFDGILCKDELTDSYVKFGGFEDYSTENGHSILDYLSNFIKKYDHLVKMGMEFPT